MTAIVVSRVRTGFGIVRRLKVFVDGREAATVRVGGTARVEVEPGEHRVSVKMDWTTSPEVAVTVDGSRDVALEAAAPGVLKALALTFSQPGRVWDLRLAAPPGTSEGFSR